MVVAMSDDLSDRVTRLEVQQDTMEKDLERVERSSKEEIKTIKTNIGWVVMLVVAFFINRVLGLFSIGGGQ